MKLQILQSDFFSVQNDIFVAKVCKKSPQKFLRIFCSFKIVLNKYFRISEPTKVIERKICVCTDTRLCFIAFNKNEIFQRKPISNTANWQQRLLQALQQMGTHIGFGFAQNARRGRQRQLSLSSSSISLLANPLPKTSFTFST